MNGPCARLVVVFGNLAQYPHKEAKSYDCNGTQVKFNPKSTTKSKLQHKNVSQRRQCRLLKPEKMDKAA